MTITVKSGLAEGFGGTGDLNALAETLVAELSRLYRRRQSALFAVATEAASGFSRARAEQLLRQVEAEVAFLDREAARWARKASASAYELGAAVSEQRLASRAYQVGIDFSNTIHAAAVDALAQSIAADLLTANDSIRRTFNGFIRATQQKLVEDREISRIVAEGVIQGEARRTTSEQIYRTLTARMGNGQFVTINGKNYEPRYYSELVARTRTREAVTQGTINTALAYGNDLVQVSVHEHPQNDPCLLYQGKIYSLSGGSVDFPPLEARPPFHPNCRHTLLPVSATALEARGLYERMSVFSHSDQYAPSAAAFRRGDFRTELPERRRGPMTRAARANAARRMRERSANRAKLREATA